MAVITDYASLTQAVVDVTEDDGLEMANYIPTAIDLAEERLFKELDLQDLETKVLGTLTSGSNLLGKPSGYKFDSYFAIIVGTTKTLLKQRTDDYLVDYWPNSAVLNVPKYYTDSSFYNFVLAPTPDQNYAYELKCTTQPVKLSPTNTTNYYTEQCEDMLFYATMVEIGKFQKAWSQIPVWETQLASATGDWNLQAMRKRRDAGETPRNPAGGENTIKHTETSNA